MIAINKLFILEGLPGTGKSSTAEFVAEYLSTTGLKTRWYDDQDLSHPAEYTFHAFMRDDQIRKLAPDEQRQVFSEGLKKRDGYIIPLTKISVSLFEKILPYKIYGQLDWETEKSILQEHWREFTDQWQRSDTVHVFDSCFVQNPVGEMMMRFDFPIEEMQRFLRDTYDIISCLNPVVIYLKSTDIGKHLESLYKNGRPSSLDMWVEFHTAQGYGRRQNLTGYDGYLTCLNDRQRVELELLDNLDIPRLIVSDPYSDWDEAQEQITSYLNNLSAAKVRT